MCEDGRPGGRGGVVGNPGLGNVQRSPNSFPSTFFSLLGWLVAAWQAQQYADEWCVFRIVLGEVQ